MVVDGESVLDTKLRMANIELINTLGVSKENLTACLECHCPGSPPGVSCRRCVFCLCSSGTRVGLPMPAQMGAGESGAVQAQSGVWFEVAKFTNLLF